MVPFRSGLATNPRASHGDDPGAAGGARARDGAAAKGTAAGKTGEGHQIPPKAAARHAATLGRRGWHAARARQEAAEGAATRASASADVLGGTAFPRTGAPSAIANTLSGALVFPARPATAGARLYQSSRSTALGYGGRT
jgi:hypothetical protein